MPTQAEIISYIKTFIHYFKNMTTHLSLKLRFKVHFMPRCYLCLTGGQQNNFRDDRVSWRFLLSHCLALIRPFSEENSNWSDFVLQPLMLRMKYHVRTNVPEDVSFSCCKNLSIMRKKVSEVQVPTAYHMYLEKDLRGWIQIHHNYWLL